MAAVEKCEWKEWAFGENWASLSKNEQGCRWDMRHSDILFLDDVCDISAYYGEMEAAYKDFKLKEHEERLKLNTCDYCKKEFNGFVFSDHEDEGCFCSVECRADGEGGAIKEKEAVNHPSHYQSKSGIEVIDVIEGYGLGFHLGNAVKYILRAGKKGERKQDLQKALWYLKRELERQDEQGEELEVSRP